MQVKVRMSSEHGSKMNDEDFETSLECEDAKAFAPPKTGLRRSLSVFELDIEGLEDKKKKSEYEEALEKEAKEWKNLLKSKLSHIEKIETERVLLDKSVLSKESLTIIENSSDFQEVVRESQEFCGIAYSFLAEREEFLDAAAAFRDTLDIILDHKAFDSNYSCLYSK